ncbi:MAG TPA: cardiolipin synthase ClsB [Pusillimonas sp.]|jgi:cardiolipin synthase|nr:cardiolipin synthase ClsB [Pusillimonas sp.]MBC41790.1 cardiolipin synthase ClsB [Pusillimonas sp.]HBT34182.1 cardiolipin synthase ClsB [Pusillimonas sp.]HCN71098.1 cardiolipin synthase ClsB [Pusillimonas sp.]HCP77408.1 cardiolipin synthase ClsB [Pusillimonas sp.]|tara:strand:+ start:180494 stop:181738 length:1245 start_codon:yes stop_codon:yes gene_type:complete
MRLRSAERRYADFALWREGNDIALLQNGQAYFPALCNDIDQARYSVHLETYIFNLDEAGYRVLRHLSKACERGVKVRVVVDGFGSHEHIPELQRRFAQMGAKFRVYRPEPRGIVSYRFSLRRLRRLHRKVVVIDQELAFVGGINVHDDLVDVPNDGYGPKPRFDFAVRIQGPVVNDLRDAQIALWAKMAWRQRENWAPFYKRLRYWRRRQRTVSTRAKEGVGSLRAAVLFRDNVRYRKLIEHAYISAINRAVQHVLIANSYFLPSRALKKALQDAASRGVSVRLFLQGRSEYALQYRACRSMYGSLLANGIEIFEYLPSYLHAKVAVIDDRAMVGSANMDPFSLLLAREANVYIDDAGFARDLRARLEAEIKESSQHVTSLAWEKVSWWTRCLDASAHALLRLGVALTGRSAEY